MRYVAASFVRALSAIVAGLVTFLVGYEVDVWLGVAVAIPVGLVCGIVGAKLARLVEGEW